jgi:hypothetical protein
VGVFRRFSFRPCFLIGLAYAAKLCGHGLGFLAWTLKLQSKILELGRGVHSANIPTPWHQENASCNDACRDKPTTTQSMSTLLPSKGPLSGCYRWALIRALPVCRVERHELILGGSTRREKTIGERSLQQMALAFATPDDLNFFQHDLSTRVES